MRTICVIGVLCCMCVILGCASVADPSFHVVTKQDGKVVSDKLCEAMPVAEVDKTKYDVQLKDGKVSWSVKVSNPLALRSFMTGTITATTNPPGVIWITFSGTVEGNTTDGKFEQVNMPVAGLPVGATIQKVSVAVIPGAGCETPNTHVPGNWPKAPLVADISFVSESAKEVKEIPAPVLDVAVKGIEVNEKGGRKFFWTLTATNNEDMAVDITVTTQWTLDSGEKIPAIPTVFVLQAKETRTIECPPVRTNKEFREVSGRSTLTSKKYIKK